jgi:CxxC motif-containing protein
MSQHTINHYLCIGCPLGCRLEVEQDDKTDDIVEVRGWSCKKGDRYGRQEHVDPRRMVTTTVRISGAVLARLPVKTSEPIPKGQVEQVCAMLREINIDAPVAMGDVVVSDIAGSGADIVATRDMD